MSTGNFPIVVEQDVSLSFDPHAAIFVDHFPGAPLVPAFMQMAAVRHHAAQHLECPLIRILARSVKFVRPLMPGRPVTLRLEQGTRSGTLHFSLSTEGERVTYGDLALG